MYSKFYQNRTVQLGGLQACHSVVGKKISSKSDFVQREKSKEKKLLSRVGRRGDDKKLSGYKIISDLVGLSCLKIAVGNVVFFFPQV